MFNSFRLFRIRRNSLQIRIIIMFLILDIVLSALLATTGILNTRRLNELYSSRISEEKISLEKSLSQSSALTEAMVSDYSVWDDTYSYLLGELPEYPELNISEDSLSTFEADVVWLYKTDFSIATTLSTFGYSPSLDDKKQKIEELFSTDYATHFYMEVPEGLLDVFGTTVVPSDDYEHKSIPAGYLFVGRLITNESLAELQDEYITSLKLIDANEINSLPPKPPARSGILAYEIERLDIDGNIIKYIYVVQIADSLREIDSLATRLLWLNGITFATVILFSYYGARKWVISPLNTVYDGLESEDTTELKKIMGTKTEFSKIALLINSFFEQQNLLKEETKEKEKIISKLEKQDSELATTNEAMIGRELKMIELKDEIKKLKDELGKQG